ncbi:hypothetical protein D3C76_1798970 [compost metagenome]
MHAVSLRLCEQAVDELLGDLRFQAIQLRDSTVAAKRTIRGRFHGRNRTKSPVVTGYDQAGRLFN